MNEIDVIVKHWKCFFLRHNISNRDKTVYRVPYFFPIFLHFATSKRIDIRMFLLHCQHACFYVRLSVEVFHFSINWFCWTLFIISVNLQFGNYVTHVLFDHAFKIYNTLIPVSIENHAVSLYHKTSSSHRNSQIVIIVSNIVKQCS